MFLATGLAAASPGWVVMSEPTSSHHRHHHHDASAASDELCFPVGVALAVIGVVVAAIPEDTSAVALAKAFADEAPFVTPP